MQSSIFLMSIICLAAAVLSYPLQDISSEESDNYLTDSDEQYDSSKETLDIPSNSTNGTAQNLYVIKVVVYEIGILTNADENDTMSVNDTLTNERVDLTFFNADKNGSIIDLGNIPLPVQTNISGHIYTGIAPVDLGSIVNPELSSSKNLSENLLSDTPFAEALQNFIPAMNLPEISNDTSSVPVDIFNSSANSGLVIPHLVQLNTVLEPLPVFLNNQSFFISQGQ